MMNRRMLYVLAICGILARPTISGADPPPSRTIDRQPAFEVEVIPLGAWLFGRTRNFQLWIIGSETELRQIARLCEETRENLQRKWSGEEQPDWSPRCDVVVYPRAVDFERALGPAAHGASGDSTINTDGGRVIKRRIDIRGDSPNWQREVLPHELTHVVLADQFIERRIPPWADEGLAILAESDARLALRRHDLNVALWNRHYLNTRQVLEARDAPLGAARGAFYAESASLAAFLMRRGGPKRLLAFVHAAQRDGYERALQTQYRLDLNQLERAWYAEWMRFDVPQVEAQD